MLVLLFSKIHLRNQVYELSFCCSVVAFHMQTLPCTTPHLYHTITNALYLFLLSVICSTSCIKLIKLNILTTFKKYIYLITYIIIYTNFKLKNKINITKILLM